MYVVYQLFNKLYCSHEIYEWNIDIENFYDMDAQKTV